MSNKHVENNSHNQKIERNVDITKLIKIINLLYESLPDTISVDGEDFKINTDYKYWLELSDALIDENVDNTYLANVIINLFVEQVPKDFSKVYPQLKWFLEGNVNEISEATDNTSNTSKNVRVLDYRVDAVYIISAFKQYYNIDLFCEDMHWWIFKSLLIGLDNKSEIKQRIYYRSVDVGTIKDKNERKRVAKIQNSLRLKTRELSDEEIANIF